MNGRRSNHLFLVTGAASSYMSIGLHDKQKVLCTNGKLKKKKVGKKNFVRTKVTEERVLDTGVYLNSTCGSAWEAAASD